MSIIAYVVITVIILFMIVTVAVASDDNVTRAVSVVIFSAMLAMVTGIAVNRWSWGVPGQPMDFNDGVYYRVVGIGTSDGGNTPILLKLPNNLVRALEFSGSVTNVTNGMFCKIVKDKNNQYTLEPLR